ncbi:MAG: 6-phosphogluconolactonase [Acetobacteraceae bacterium]|nr:6-phosphogluconolactonase [Acetobacteraceae bacterium]
MAPAIGTVRVFENGAALADGLAAFLCEQAERASAPFVVSAAGGSTPKPAYHRLAEAPYKERMPWDRVHWILGDERFVVPTDPASNFGMICDEMLAHVPAPKGNIHPVPTEGVTLDEAAAQYEAELKRLYGADQFDPARPLIDVCLLGLGDDGHTASLIPGQPVLEERSKWVASVGHGRPEQRVTLTYPALESSRLVVFLVSGEGKRAILDQVLSGGSDVPAARLKPVGEVIWFADRAAAGRWA